MACKTLQKFRLGLGNGKALRTKQKFVFVNDICDSEIESPKDHDLRLNNAICDGNHKHKDSLWVYSSIVDHRRSVEFSKI